MTSEERAALFYARAFRAESGTVWIADPAYPDPRGRVEIRTPRVATLKAPTGRIIACDPTDAVLPRSYPAFERGGEFEVTAEDGAPANVVLFRAGYGDGVYPCFIGRAASGEPRCWRCWTPSTRRRTRENEGRGVPKVPPAFRVRPGGGKVRVGLAVAAGVSPARGGRPGP